MKGLKRLFRALALLSYFLLNYIPALGWYFSSVSSVFIIIFGYLSWGRNVIYILGIKFTSQDFIKTIFLSIVVSYLSFLLINKIASINNITIEWGNLLSYYHIFFYTLNEEMILGAFLLFSLQKKCNNLPIVFISIFVALLFSIIHYVFYKWIFADWNRGNIQILTLLALFSVGILRNNLILLKRNIGFAWAIHFGFMAVLYGSVFFNTLEKRSLKEVEKLNYFIGNYWILIISLIFAIITTILILKKPPTVTQK